MPYISKIKSFFVYDCLTGSFNSITVFGHTSNALSDENKACGCIVVFWLTLSADTFFDSRELYIGYSNRATRSSPKTFFRGIA